MRPQPAHFKTAPMRNVQSRAAVSPAVVTLVTLPDLNPSTIPCSDGNNDGNATANGCANSADGNADTVCNELAPPVNLRTLEGQGFLLWRVRLRQPCRQRLDSEPQQWSVLQDKRSSS
jgi:hypothetical protein